MKAYRHQGISKETPKAWYVAFNWEKAESEYNRHYDPYGDDEGCECEECGEFFEEGELTHGICSHCVNNKDCDFDDEEAA